MRDSGSQTGASNREVRTERLWVVPAPPDKSTLFKGRHFHPKTVSSGQWSSLSRNEWMCSGSPPFHTERTGQSCWRRALRSAPSCRPDAGDRGRGRIFRDGVRRTERGWL